MKDLVVKVINILGECENHVVGDFFVLKGGRLSLPVNKHVCIYALSSLLPLLPAKQRKIAETDDWLIDTFHVECPDPKGRVIWEISNLEKTDLAE